MRSICGIIAKDIGSEDSAQNEYDNLADDIESWISRKGLPSQDIVNKIREIATEERIHRKELIDIFRHYNCHLGESGGVIKDKSV